MTNNFECVVDAGEEAVFSALVHATQRASHSGFRFSAHRVSVEPSRLGRDEAFSVRLQSQAGAAEIGKIILVPLTGMRHLLTIPLNRTGGAQPPELDLDGDHFRGVLIELLARLQELRLYHPAVAGGLAGVAMDIDSSIGRKVAKLEEFLAEVEHLRTLQFDNEELPLWIDKVQDTLRIWFGPSSLEYNRFEASGSTVLVPDFAGGRTRQRQYLDELQNREGGLKSVIQLLELRQAQDAEPSSPKAGPLALAPRVFIAHGGQPPALGKLKDFLTALGCEPIIAEEQPSEDRSVNEQVEWCLKQSDCGIVLDTAEDLKEDKLHSKPNVHIELGRFQERFPGKTIYLLEEGAKLPSNVDEKVWERFTQENMEKAFLKVVRELRAFGYLTTGVQR